MALYEIRMDLRPWSHDHLCYHFSGRPERVQDLGSDTISLVTFPFINTPEIRSNHARPTEPISSPLSTPTITEGVSLQNPLLWVESGKAQQPITVKLADQVMKDMYCMSMHFQKCPVIQTKLELHLAPIRQKKCIHNSFMA